MDMDMAMVYGHGVPKYKGLLYINFHTWQILWVILKECEKYVNAT